MVRDSDSKPTTITWSVKIPWSVKMAQHIGDKGRREYVYTPERPSAVFLLGCTHHRNGDGGCEPAQLNVVARVRPEGPLSTTYIGPCRRRSRNGSRTRRRISQAA